jgi:streptomycin 6-kinase
MSIVYELKKHMEIMNHIPSNKIQKMALSWVLTELIALPSAHHYLFSGFQNKIPIVLKLGSNLESLKQEAAALRAFALQGAIQILDEAEGALLLERALPGTSLKTYFPNREEASLKIVCDLIQKLYEAPTPEQHSFPSVGDWLSALDTEVNIPPYYLKKARALKNQLLETSDSPVLLHGDLHHDNILKTEKGWVMIDPKGVIGERAYEVGAFIRNPLEEWLTSPDAPQIIEKRIQYFAKYLTLDPKRIRQWCFVQAILAWGWALEDGADTHYFERLAHLFSTHV